MPRSSSASSTFGPLKRTPAYRLLSEQIERRILDGALRPGDPMPTEQELADDFGVNRSTVREAIRLLEQEGLLVRTAGRRLQVSRPGVGDLASRAARSMVSDAVSFREVWQVGIVLEPLAARLAALNADDADLAALEENLARTEEVLARGTSYVELDGQFHALLARASGNRMLMLSREPLSLLLAPSFERLRKTLPQAGRRNLEAHRRIVDAVRRRDPDEAERWTRRHYDDFHRGYRVARLDTEAPLAWPGEPHSSFTAATTETEETTR